MKVTYNLLLPAMALFVTGLFAMQEGQLNIMISNQTDYPCLVFTAEKLGSQPMIIKAAEEASNILMTSDRHKDKIFMSTKHGAYELHYIKPIGSARYQLGLYSHHQSKDDVTLLASNNEAGVTDILVVIDPVGKATLTNRTQTAKAEVKAAKAQESFMNALKKGDQETAAYWLAHGASVNAMNTDGTRPLTYFAKEPPHVSFEAFEFLLDHGALVDCQDVHGSTALLCLIMVPAYYAGKGSDMIAELLARGADPRIRNNDGVSACEFVKNGHARYGAVPQREKQILIDRGLGREFGLV